MNELASVLDQALDLGLKGEERWFRADVSRGIELREGQPRIDRAAGIIYGYSVITKGPALGHNMQVDDTTLGQIVELGNHATLGIKSRFDHPSASNTSMGTFIGRSKNFRSVGERVLADLHLSDAAKDAPQGDLHKYVIGLAEHDPQAFGASIVFEGKSEEQLNPDGTRKNDEQGNPLPRLARVDTLLASDVVDDPAANPGGLFSHADSLAAKLTQFLNRWATHDLLPQLRAAMSLHTQEEMRMDTGTAVITPQQLESARSEGREVGVQAERARVAAIHKSFASVWGENPPAHEITVRDGLIELGIDSTQADTDFKRRKLTQITESAPLSAGGGGATLPTTVDRSALSLEDRCKAEFESTPALREEFGKLSTYLAFKQAESRGQVRIKSK
jgi:hypothetical protein